ncbi:hypothetical protein Mgra_00008950 [Meloidogyne graminicola]|uniref:Uncharacterized protein n=1 Tax=Meloidogyne graminicola TaxID=189291 RepID=A0A8S9ZEC9_9BILA|nr:hypothetical protein Mgra_00008950 [Meloidogyne graminicola]
MSVSTTRTCFPHWYARNSAQVNAKRGFTSLCGRPAAEKMGIFCPRAMLFITSIAEIPTKMRLCVIVTDWSRFITSYRFININSRCCHYQNL